MTTLYKKNGKTRDTYITAMRVLSMKFICRTDRAANEQQASIALLINHWCHIKPLWWMNTCPYMSYVTYELMTEQSHNAILWSVYCYGNKAVLFPFHLVISYYIPQKNTSIAEASYTYKLHHAKASLKPFSDEPFPPKDLSVNHTLSKLVFPLKKEILI